MKKNRKSEKPSKMICSPYGRQWKYPKIYHMRSISKQRFSWYWSALWFDILQNFEVIITYSTEEEKAEEHYFEVEMFEINKENTDLLNEKRVREYLSFVIPVPYRNTFILRSHIYTYAQKLGYKIDEYCVRVNGSQIFKEYTTKLKEQSGAVLKNYDEISRLEFKDFRSADGELIAWMWVGLSRFEKQIPKVNAMRGLRVRSSNIRLY